VCYLKPTLSSFTQTETNSFDLAKRLLYVNLSLYNQLLATRFQLGIRFKASFPPMVDFNSRNKTNKNKQQYFTDNYYE